MHPQAIVVDAHPDYLNKQYLNNYKDIKIIEVQHHHAHIAAVMQDINHNEPVIGLAFDGTGYGTDGTIWGSEFLIADKKQFKRVGCFQSFPLPGGDRAVKDIWKIGLSLLYQLYKENIPDKFNFVYDAAILELLQKNISCPLTCSIGRIFDGVAAILQVAKTVSTEAEAAMLLEELARQSSTEDSFEIAIAEKDGLYEVQTFEIIQQIISMIQQDILTSDIAMVFHNSLVQVIAAMLCRLREKYAINSIVFSGGVFQNRIMLKKLLDTLNSLSFDVLLPQNIPFNDGSLAMGQIAIAQELML